MPDNVRDYLIKERGLTEEIIKNKKIGFCKDNDFDIDKENDYIAINLSMILDDEEAAF